MAGGLHPAIAPKYFRIGHMGISAMEDDRGHIDNVLRVSDRGLQLRLGQWPRAPQLPR